MENNLEPLEIERKFLLRQLPDGLIDGEQIAQGYLAIDANQSVVRLRQKGDKYYLTVKGAGMIMRNEWEMEIPETQFALFWPATIGRRLEKTRYIVNLDDAKVEVDKYHGPLEGLVTAEVEFTSLEEAKKFVTPDWLSEEVTEDVRFKNSNLVKLQVEELKELLS